MAGVGMVLMGVLNLLGNLLSGLGLDSLLKGIFAATVSYLNACTRRDSTENTIRALTRFSLGLALVTYFLTRRSNYAFNYKYSLYSKF